MWLYVLLAVLMIILLIVLTVCLQSSNVEPMEQVSEEKFSFPVFVINLDRKPERYTYMTNQLDSLEIKDYQRISATDGFKCDPEEITKVGISPILINKGKGLAGCAASHVKLWRHIAENKLGWTLILEDDAHFHPRFKQLFPKYWSKIPKDAKIVFPGHCAPANLEKPRDIVVEAGVMCLQGYMINHSGAQYLLDKLLPIADPVDIAIVEHFRHRSGSYIFNGNATVDGIRPNDYKEANGKRCMFNGIIYQNQAEQGSTIHKEETIFE